MKKFILATLFIFSINYSRAQLVSETIIGQTMYDIQCNSSSYNRLSCNSDGTISAAWTFSPDSSFTMPLRGTGYNYFDGTTWGAWPTSRTETERTGFTNIVTTRSGQELSVQHTIYGIGVNYRPVKGTGAWTFTKPWGNNNNDTWSKAVSAGDSVYAIWSGTGTAGTQVAGQQGPILFSSSFDGGQTWSPKIIIPLIDSSYYSGFAAEHYAIDAKGSTVAILFGDPRTDLGILKSQDGGITWAKIIVKEHPIPGYGNYEAITDTNADGLVDTLLTPYSDHAILIDNNGDCHVWFSQIYWYCDLNSVGSYNYFPEVDGINYWNENMGMNSNIKIALPLDLNGNGVVDYPVNPGLCAMYYGGPGYYPATGKPSLGIDASGTIYMAYQSLDESADTTIWGGLHTHCYVKTLPQIAGTYDVNNWTYPFDISRSVAQGGNGEFEECIFPSIGRNVGQYAYVLYQRDAIPGLRQSSCPAASQMNSYTNDIVVAKIEAATVGIQQTNHPVITAIGVSPNPAQNKFLLQFNIKEQSDVRIELVSLTGKIVYTNLNSSVSVGAWKEEISTSALSPGIYTCSVIAKGQKSSCKVVIIP